MEKERLFYNLHQTIKSIGIIDEELKYSDGNNWVKDLSSQISQMDDEMLDIVLNIYSKLTTYTRDNISFIICNSDSLRDIFYKNGILVEENLQLLYEPYCHYLIISPVVTLHCFRKNIKEFEEIIKTVVFNPARDVIERLILGKDVSNLRIVGFLDTLFELSELSPKFVESIADNAGPLHKMQMEIYQKTRPEDADNQRCEYVEYLSKNKNNNYINKVIDYITSNEFEEYTTVQKIQSLNIDYLPQLISKYGEKIAYEEFLAKPNLKELFKKSPKLAMRLFDLYTEGKIDGDLDSIANTYYPLTNHFKLIEKIL